MTRLARGVRSLRWGRAMPALLVGGWQAATAATYCPPTVVEGVDVSAAQGIVVWPSVQGSGRGFAYASATQGNTQTDPRFGNNWPAIKAAGMLRGAMHFFDPTIDGVTQANYFLAAINGAGGLDKTSDLPAALDLECPTSSVQGSADANCVAPGNSGWVAHATLVQRVIDWLTTVQNATGKRPMIYTYSAWYANVGFADVRLAQYPLFIPTYDTCADVPTPWSSAAFWQYSPSGSVPGIAGSATNLDRFAGSAAALQRLVETIFTSGFEGLSQLITFTSTTPVGATFGGTYNASATASSGLPVTLTIDASAASACSINSNLVSFNAGGLCVINANQAGDATWSPAPQAQQTFAIAKANQTINFTSSAPGNAHIGDPVYAPIASASSGLPVTLSIDASAASVCSLTGGNVSFTASGTCVINADQAGDGAYNAAPQVQQIFLVSKLDQTITFTSTAPTPQVGDAAYVPTATATSGLAVTFSIDASATSVCSISGGSVSYIAAGLCVINADQAGDTTYNAAPQVQQSFTVAGCISLAVGQVVMADMPGGASVCIANTAAADADYTYIPINLGTAASVGLSLTGTGIQAAVGPPTPRPAPEGDALALAPLQETLTAMASGMHGIETPAAFPAGHTPSAADLLSQPHGGVTPLVVGQLIDLDGSIGGCGVASVPRKGRVEAITAPQFAGQKVIYAVQDVIETTPGAGDWHPEVPGGYTTAMFQSVIDSFVQAPPGFTTDPDGAGTLSGLLKTAFLDIATTNFGAMTDLDANGGLILFFTPQVNRLSPAASSAVVQGVFLPRDMFSSASCPASNEGEILYMMVPDPTGVINSNVRTVSFVYGGAPVTLVHFYEHLLSAWRRTYSPSGQLPLETLWLDEALAWQGQELAFWNASVGLTPRNNVALSNLTTGPNASVRVNDFNAYENPMFGHGRTWFFQLNGTNGNKRVGPLQQTPASTGSVPTVHENASPNYAIGYTFLRYMLDRKNTGDAALLNALVNSSDTGLTNLQTVFGQASMNNWLRDFLVAIYTDDSGVPVTAEYTMPSWNLRSVYGGLGGYPLTTNALANNTALVFSLYPGGGSRYARFGIIAGGSATISLTEGGSPPNAQVSTALVRTR